MTEEGEDEIGLKQMLYQMQLLQAFDITEYNDDIMNNKIITLYQEIKDTSFVKILIQQNPHTIHFEEPELIFRTLFSYDYFDLFHKCLYYYSKNEPVDHLIELLLNEFNTK
jgi:hypothetical protein